MSRICFRMYFVVPVLVFILFGNNIGYCQNTATPETTKVSDARKDKRVIITETIDIEAADECLGDAIMIICPSFFVRFGSRVFEGLKFISKPFYKLKTHYKDNKRKDKLK